jgi:hypothetical protein
MIGASARRARVDPDGHEASIGHDVVDAEERAEGPHPPRVVRKGEAGTPTAAVSNVVEQPVHVAIPVVPRCRVEIARGNAPVSGTRNSIDQRRNIVPVVPRRHEGFWSSHVPDPEIAAWGDDADFEQVAGSYDIAQRPSAERHLPPARRREPPPPAAAIKQRSEFLGP